MSTMNEGMDVEEHVNAAENDEDEFEEVLVYVDFPDFDECRLISESTIVELRDVCGEAPTCKIGELNFVGQHEINLGTQLFVNRETGQCIGSSTSVLNFRLSSIDTGAPQDTDEMNEQRPDEWANELF